MSSRSRGDLCLPQSEIFERALKRRLEDRWEDLVLAQCLDGELARALVVEPNVMLLDEPSIELEPKYIDQVFERIQQLNDLETTILLVEQNAQKGLSVADRRFVLASGETKFTGTGTELLNDNEVGRLYLGG